MLPADPIAARTLVLLTIFFALAGLCVLAAEWRAKAPDRNLRQRYGSWYVIAPAVLVPAWFGGLPFALLVLALALWCLHEFFVVAGVRQLAAWRWVGRIAGFALVWTAIFSCPSISWPFSLAVPAWQSVFGASPVLGVPLFYVMPIFIIMMVLVIPVVLGKYEGMLTAECVTIFGILYFGWFLGHLVFLRSLNQGFGYLVFLCAAVVLNDVCAYTCGRLWGRTKMAPLISPRKTWEGAAGGLAGSLLAVAVFGYAAPELPAAALVGAGLVIGVCAPLGDLVVSVIKRDMHVKDSGQLIPGHGGLLDRCDSLIFATPGFYYYLLLVRHFTGAP